MCASSERCSGLTNARTRMHVSLCNSGVVFFGSTILITGRTRSARLVPKLSATLATIPYWPARLHSAAAANDAARRFTLGQHTAIRDISLWVHTCTVRVREEPVMMNFRRILFPVEFSPECQLAAAHVAAWAK